MKVIRDISERRLRPLLLRPLRPLRQLRGLFHGPAPCPPSPRGRACALALCLGLAACGGGGGGGEPQGGQAAPPSLPLPPAAGTGGQASFTPLSAGRVAGYPLWASEHVLRLAHTLGREVEELRADPGAARSGDCEARGTFQRHWDDRDGSGTLSAGDVLSVTYAQCSRFGVLRWAQGSASVLVLSTSPEGGAVLDLSFTGAGMGLEADLLDPRQVGLRITGGARLELLRTVTRNGLVVGNGRAEELVLEVPGWSFPGDRMTAFRLEKTQRWDEARTVLDLRMTYTSPELGGAFQVLTPEPVRAWLNEMPEAFPGQGRIEMRGAQGDLVRLTVMGTGGTGTGTGTGVAGGGSVIGDELRVELDQRGDGSVEAGGSGRWSDIGLVAGFFFRDLSDDGQGQPVTLFPGGFRMRPPLTLQPQPVDSSWRVQFTRPPADPARWRWQLLDLGRLPFNEGAQGEVPITVEQLGALFIVRPQAPLRYSRRYELRLDTGEADEIGTIVRATTGQTLRVFRGQVAQLETLDILNPSIVWTTLPGALRPGQEVGLQWRMQPDRVQPGTTVLWSQIDGPPLSFLTFSPADARQTVVRLEGAGTGVASATVALTLTLPDGTREAATLPLRVVFDTTGPWISRVRVPSPAGNDTLLPKDIWGGPAVGSLQASVADGVLRVRYVDQAGPSSSYPGWTILLSDAQGNPPAPGRYEDAWSAAAVDRPQNVPRMDFEMEDVDFRPFGSEFDLHEIETDAQGRVTRLALDFVVRGVGDYGAIPGWVRINSDRPPPSP